MVLPHLDVQEWVVSWIEPETGEFGTSNLVCTGTDYFPVTREFWKRVRDFISEKNNGARLVAITPIRYEQGHVADWAECDDKQDLDAYIDAKEKSQSVPEPFLKLVT